MRTISIGNQNFANIREHNDFLVDKTAFIREWWESRDEVTLITRPRRFGKTFNMNMLNSFFSVRYAGRSDLFEGLDIWKSQEYRQLQGTYPVIFLSFASIKGRDMKFSLHILGEILTQVFWQNTDLLESDKLTSFQKKKLEEYCSGMTEMDMPGCLNFLSQLLYIHYGKKCLILLDEYDTPLLEAYTNGYWDEMSDFIRVLFNSTFKTNPWLERAVMTGITRVSKESIFSDLNNLNVVTTTSEQYESAFGFTQEEVFAALDEYGLSEQKEEVKRWYDGYTFGNTPDIYNPWSIINFLKQKGNFDSYWANTSGNNLISHELRVAGSKIKHQMEALLNGGTIKTRLDEQIIYTQLETRPDAIWSLFLATGYLKIVKRESDSGRKVYTLALTNYEVRLMFEDLIGQWFSNAEEPFSGFIKALISGNEERVCANLQEVLISSVSFYDTGKTVSENRKPESFYHGLVLGMIVQEKDYHITSNRESGDGRYDVLMMPGKETLPAIIIEFKTFDPKEEKTLDDTADRALTQIKEKNYDAEVISSGISRDRILHYGMGFSGKKVAVHRG